MVTGSFLFALSGLWFLLIPDANPNYLRDWLPGLLLNGISIGLVMPSLSSAAVYGLPPKDYAVGSAINQAMRQIGTVIGVSIAVLFLAKSQLTVTDFRPTYLIHIALALITAILCIPIKTHPKHFITAK